MIRAQPPGALCRRGCRPPSEWRAPSRCWHARGRPDPDRHGMPRLGHRPASKRYVNRRRRKSVPRPRTSRDDEPPAAVSAHREARQIDAGCVDVLLRDDLPDGDDGRLHGLGVFDRFALADLEWCPGVVLGALWRQDEAVPGVEMRRIEESLGKVGQLTLVVVASFSCSMEKDHERGGSVVIGRFQDSIWIRPVSFEFERTVSPCSYRVVSAARVGDDIMRGPERLR